VGNLLLSELIEVTQNSEKSFEGNCLTGAHGRIFGGQVAAQAMRSATLIVPDNRNIHSFACLFLRPGNPELKVRYEVTELRNGKSLSTYRVDAYQDNESVKVSFLLQLPRFIFKKIVKVIKMRCQRLFRQKNVNWELHANRE
jgi:acyl-CoA thioesterase II